MLPAIEYIDFKKQDDIVPLYKEWVKATHSFLSYLNEQRGKMCLCWDPDVDGIFSGYIALKFIKKHFPNITVLNYMHETKVHGVNDLLIYYCLENDVDLLMCVDCGSSDYDQLSRLTSKGIKVIVCDHHLIEGYKDYKNDINVTLINANLMKGYEELSGATMTLYLMTQVTGDKALFHELIELAIVTIVSDICPTETINKRIMLNYVYSHYKSNAVLENVQGHFNITRNFLISFSSKLNAVIRYCGPRYLMEVVSAGLENLQDINFKHIKQKDTERIELLQERMHIYDFNNIIIAVFSDEVSEYYKRHNVRNYIGIIANKLSSKYNKLAIVMMPSRADYEMYNFKTLFTYSARDCLSRSAINLFANEKGFKANGHLSAFGGTITREFNFDEMVRIDKELSNMKKDQSNKVIPVEDIAPFIRDNNPYVIKVGIMNNVHREQYCFEGYLNGYIKSKGYHKEIVTDGIKMKSYDLSINLYSKVRVIPIFSGKEIEYIVERCK